MTVTFTRADDPARPKGPRWRVGVGAVVVLLLVLAAVAVAVTAFSSGSGSTELVDGDASGSGASSGSPFGDATAGGSTADPGSGAGPVSGSVFVHVLGQVVTPGLYEVPAGSRLVDVVAAAGGFTADADQGGVNLARTVADGEQVRVPAVGEEPPAPEGGGAGAGGAALGSGPADGLVHLGTATAADLETLPGVGPATSAAILAWRDEHGGFRTVDDLLEVPGIGEKTLEKLRPLVAP
ncbi:helix-hairpin-helix domain-containing protein [Frigoribacterium salinisoli]